MNVKETLLAAVIGLAFVATAHAQEATVTPVAATSEVVKVDPVPSEQLLTSFEAICDSDAKLSDKALVACANAMPPKAAKSGLIFRNTGIGAEFNTLIRNQEAFNSLPVEAATAIQP